MSKGYWIVRVDVTEPESFKAYVAANVEAFKTYGARYLARAGAFHAVEGTTRSRNTIVEFPSYEEAMENSNRPETAAYAEKMMALCEGEVTFRNLDVIG